MPRPTVFRDPVHVQLRYAEVDLSTTPAPNDESQRLSWTIRKLIDTQPFQRLRHIRQNGLANLVFHGAEHSRFSHSMGTADLARRMFNNIQRNMGEANDPRARLATTTAALIHDIGHGPFSHTLEEILADAGIEFDHEVMTRRYILEDCEVHQVLLGIDDKFPNEVAAFIDKSLRDSESWYHKIVSSQLDADRLDYLHRDAACAGLKGHGFDLPRLLDFLVHVDGKSIGVDRRALETVEGYLVALDQMYRAVYYHHAIRAAGAVLNSVIRRAHLLWQKDDKAVFPPCPDGTPHPMETLLNMGQDTPLADYTRLGEYHIWALADFWKTSKDPTLADLSKRLLGRKLFKSLNVDPNKAKALQKLRDACKELAKKHIVHVDNSNVDLYILIDEPSRTGLKTYDWRGENPDESIYVQDDGGGYSVIENYQKSNLVNGLRGTKYFHRLIVPAEIRADAQKALIDLKAGAQ